MAVDGLYVEGSVIEFVARPYGDHVRFANWNDGNSDNPRRIVLTQDTLLTAHFEELIGIDAVDGQSVTCWPNPASGTVWVKSCSQMTSIVCMDADGRSVARFSPQSLEYKIDVSGWRTGVYFVKVVTTEGCKVLKLTVKAN